MKMIKKGDAVVRKSHGKDIVFIVSRIIDIKDRKLAILKGVTSRIEVDSYLEDLETIDKRRLKKEIDYFDNKINSRINRLKLYKNDYIKDKRNNKRIIEKVITGKILHLDGDRRYSEKSSYYYKKLGLKSIVRNIPENKQPYLVNRMLKQYNPDILVITGHDGMIRKGREYNNIYNYRNSKYFIETVREARKYDILNNKKLAIFAGACQSYYEAIINAGANFASSPARILIDFLDPLIIAENIAYTDRYKYITIEDMEKELRDGKRGVSGVGVNGKMIIIR